MNNKLAVIHGTGLLGSSIGLGLAASGWSVSGWDPDEDAANAALDRGAIHRRLSGPDVGLAEADLVFLCGPLAATISGLDQLDTPSLVTDISSVKTSVVQAASHLPSFVGGHPMAGSAASGAQFASEHMFQGASWILCTDNAPAPAISEMEAIVSSLGANPIVMTAEDHDRYVAMVSHLPRVLASTLVDMVGGNPEAARLSAGSFRDLTRVAGSAPDWWTDVLLGNRAAVISSIEDLISRLENWRSELGDDARDKIEALLLDTKTARARFGAPVAEVRVVLFDRPGEIARVGKALSDSSVDLRDIQLRHAEHGGGGILTLSINASEAQTLKAALAKNGFELEN